VEPPEIRHQSPPWRVVAALLILAAVLIPSDGSLSLAIRTADIPGELNRVLNRAETFGHGAGVVMIALTLVICLRPHYRTGLCAAAAAIGAGMTANIIKTMVARTRPSDLVDLASSTSPAPVFLKYSNTSAYLSHLVTKAEQSFPSAHTATAFGLATALAAMFPRGRHWFTLLAVLVGMQRIVNGAHYVSDVLTGAAVGLVVGRLVVGRFAAADARRDQALSETVISHPALQPSSETSQAA